MGLVISRRRGESVTVGNALITVTRFKGDSAVLHIEADRSIPVLRSELQELDNGKKKPKSEKTRG